MIEKLVSFMRGRNGMDQIAKDVYILSLVFLFLNSLFRCFSKNINRRALENRNYMVYRNRFMNALAFLKKKWDDRKVYRYYVCKNCGQKVRVPSGKGKIEITCPKCGNHFTKRT